MVLPILYSLNVRPLVATTSQVMTMRLLRLPLLLLPCLCYWQGREDDKVLGIGIRIPTFCLTTEGERCIFPFMFNGQKYNQCTYTNSPTPWCATMLDSNGTAITNR